MKNFIQKIGLWCLFINSIQPLSAQFVLPPITAEATDLARIKAAYNQAGVVSCDLTYHLFAPSANQAQESMTGNLTMFGNDYHFKIAHFEYIQQGNRLLYIDHEAHEMLVFNSAKSTLDPTNSGQIATILDREGVATALQNLGGNRRKLTIDAAQSGINNVDIWYNTDTYFIEHTRTIVPQTNGAVEVQYGQITREKGAFPFSISTFAVLKNKKYAVTDKFKGYTVKVMS